MYFALTWPASASRAEIYEQYSGPRPSYVGDNAMSSDDREREKTMNALREAALSKSVFERQSACLTEDVLVSFADGRLGDAERFAATQHVSTCRHCQHELGSLVRALKDPDVERAARSGGRMRLRLAGMLVPLAAAAALIIVFVVPERQRSRVPEKVHRAPVLASGPAPVGVSPVGPVSRVVELQWSIVPNAETYRVTLFDADGRVLYETQANGTSTFLPDSLKFAPAQRYLWQVQARIGFNRWVASDLVEFRIVRSQP